jgi:autotransporter-associated beta strand protein
MVKAFLCCILSKNRSKQNWSWLPEDREFRSAAEVCVPVPSFNAKKLLRPLLLLSSLLGFCLPQIARGLPGIEYWNNPAPSGIWHSTVWSLAADGTLGPQPWQDGGSAIFSATPAAQKGNYTVTLDSNVVVQNLTYTGGNQGSVLQITVAAGSTITALTSEMDVTIDPGTTMVIAPAIVGTGSSLVLTSGTLVLTGANTYTDGTAIRVGSLPPGNSGIAAGATLSIGADSALGAAGTNITLQGGELLTTGTFSTDRPITLDGSRFANILAAKGGTTLTYQGVINGNGGLQIGDGSTSGTVVFKANNAYSGATTVFTNAVLSIDRDAELGASGRGDDIKLLFGGELLTTADFTTERAVDLNPPMALPTIGIVSPLGPASLNTLAAAPGTTAIYAGLVSGPGGLVIGDLKGNTGTVILTDDNTYTGGTTISAGTLQIGNGGTSGSIIGNVTDNGHLAFDRSDTLVIFPGNISGTGTLSKLGFGTLTLSGVNTYSGVTTVRFGTLQADATTAFSPASAFTVNSVLNLAGFSNTVGSLAGSGIVTNNESLERTIVLPGTSFEAPAILTAGGNGTNTIFSGTLIDGTASLGLAKTGLGTLTLSGANTYTGGTTITGGTLQIGNGGTTGSIVGNVTDNGSLVFNRSDAVTFPGIVSGSGSLSQNGSGSLILTTANTYSGGTFVELGTPFHRREYRRARGVSESIASFSNLEPGP